MLTIIKHYPNGSESEKGYEDVSIEWNPAPWLLYFVAMRILRVIQIVALRK